MSSFIGYLLGLDNVQAIDGVSFSLAAPWAAPRVLAWLFAALCAISIVLTGVFYLRWQQRAGRLRLVLAMLRSLVLCLLLLQLFEPALVFRSTYQPKPQLWFLIDGTDSMALQDELPLEERGRLEEAVGLKAHAGGEARSADARSRIDYVRAWLRGHAGDREGKNVLRNLRDRFRLKGFLFDESVRELPGFDRWPDEPRAGAALTTKGQYTALGAALEELSRRQSTGDLAGLVVLSDFDQNSGPAAQGPAERLGAPIFAVGVGPVAARDLRLKMDAPLWMTRSEQSEITVLVEQEGLEETSVEVRLYAQKIEADSALTAERSLVATQKVQLRGGVAPAVFPYTPEATGLFRFTAEVDPLPGEVVDQNNRAEREVSLRDDFLRLLYVEYEPTWEWRFIKEVFHRDKLVGMRGFRTFLRSADPKVRQENELFVPTLTPKRGDFFAHDVIFLGDMPAAALSTRFCELTREFVGKFGGGLVVIAGPRFGPGQLAGTPLADMLPVMVDPDARLRDAQEFELKLTAEAQLHPFMRLGATPDEYARAWANLGRLPWYQPVARASDRATVLAVHPTDRCPNGQPQPLIALRQYGDGIVVYVGFNETWRLRRKYGERFYRQFWGQMIHQLASRRALGTQKRFVVRTDRPQYRVDDELLLTVEAYDADYQPLSDEKLPEGWLLAEIVVPGRGADGAQRVEKIALTRRREATLEGRLTLDTPGEYHVRVKDPVSGQFVQARFAVADVSLERRSAVRNQELQRELAAISGGKACELHEAELLLAKLDVPRRTETSVQVVTLWSTWPAAVYFCVFLALLFTEWVVRKLLTLA